VTNDTGGYLFYTDRTNKFATYAIQIGTVMIAIILVTMVINYETTGTHLPEETP
jgi:hypothetical protein